MLVALLLTAAGATSTTAAMRNEVIVIARQSLQGHGHDAAKRARRLRSRHPNPEAVDELWGLASLMGGHRHTAKRRIKHPLWKTIAAAQGRGGWGRARQALARTADSGGPGLKYLAALAFKQAGQDDRAHEFLKSSLQDAKGALDPRLAPDLGNGIVEAALKAAEGLGDAFGEIEVINAAKTEHLDTYKAYIYERLNRKGFDAAEVHRLVARDRHVFAAAMLAHGHGDALVTGATRKSAHVLSLINHVFDARAEDGVVGVTAVLHRGRIILIADTLVHEWPSDQDLAHIAKQAAKVARGLGLEPRVAFVSFSTFGYPVSERAEKMHQAPKVLDQMNVDFEYEGEMTVDVALNASAQEAYPFSRLTGPANILVVPARHSASISVKLMQEMAGATVIGPILTGVGKPIQILPTGSSVNDIVNLAVLAACKVGD